MTTEEVYLHPEDYDLELADRDVHDLPFWISVMHAEKPRSVLEVGCGTGRLTVPLARDGANQRYLVSGIDPEQPMLERAMSRRSRLPADVRGALSLFQGDIRTVRLQTTFDVVLMPYGAAHHLLTLDDQLTAWRNARRHLREGGLFALDVDAPNMDVLHRLMKGTPRHRDLDAVNPSGRKLQRTVASRYSPSTQRAVHDYRYHATDPDGTQRCYTSTFEMHVYFPRELELLCLATGLRCERLLGSYEGAAFDDRSAQMILMARAC
ncbi:MAG: putative methyltransferase [Chloroflexi bacterium]|nr:putative methyltransferase [Chloroflexota bacterium]